MPDDLGLGTVPLVVVRIVCLFNLAPDDLLRRREETIFRKPFFFDDRNKINVLMLVQCGIDTLDVLGQLSFNGVSSLAGFCQLARRFAQLNDDGTKR